MSFTAVTLVIGWLIALVLFLGFIILLRYMQYRERIALLTHGINPNEIRRQRRSQGILRAGLITMMVGIALTIGLYPLGFLLPSTFSTAPFHLGPWLLPGLIPLGVGLALMCSYYLEPNVQNITDETKEQEKTTAQKIIPLKKHQHQEQQERQEPPS
jgi:formate hydrogenlyase subunit 3/multisubunit Na+/H+ antiporter MnhD subunit